jgi:hypothetical protein
VERPRGAVVAGGRYGPDGPGLHRNRPDRQIGIAPRRPRMWRRSQGTHTVQLQQSRSRRRCGPGIRELAAWDLPFPEHREIGWNELVLAGQVQPDLKELEPVGWR